MLDWLIRGVEGCQVGHQDLAAVRDAERFGFERVRAAGAGFLLHGDDDPTGDVLDCLRPRGFLADAAELVVGAGPWRT